MKKEKQILNKLKREGASQSHIRMIEREMDAAAEMQHGIEQHPGPENNIYLKTDFDILPGYYPDVTLNVKTLEELLDRDKKREEDGFPRRIRIGKFVKPDKDNKGQVIVVPTTTEPKFYHDDSVTEEQEEEATGGSGEGEEGEVIGEQEAEPQQGEGEGAGAGQGQGAEHDVAQEAVDLGKILTEKFELPNLRHKGNKRSFTKYTYDLTDRNRGFGQVLEKKETLKKIIETNIMLGRINPDEEVSTEDLLINPDDHVYRILSKEKDFETQAIVFFLRDYSGSMQGDPTDVITQQHLFIYSWLMYQYSGNVETRFILHDTEAKEVDDFYTYHQSQVAGGTRIAPAFHLVNKIVEEERLEPVYNIYVFHGTDGDDWDETGEDMIKDLKKMLHYANRVGITVAKNSWGGSGETTVERYINRSGLLKDAKDLFKLDVMTASEASEARIIEGIKALVI